MLYLAVLSPCALVTVVTILPKLLLGDCGHHLDDCCWVTAVTLQAIAAGVTAVTIQGIAAGVTAVTIQGIAAGVTVVTNSATLPTRGQGISAG